MLAMAANPKSSSRTAMMSVWDTGNRLSPCISPSFFNRRALRETLAGLGLDVQSWSELGEVVHHPPGWRARALRYRRAVDRVTVVARRNRAEEDTFLESYFHGTHAQRRWS